jgi:hypothetical protein
LALVIFHLRGLSRGVNPKKHLYLSGNKEVEDNSYK